MPRPQPDLTRRTLTLDTQRRRVDLPLDASGHLRRLVPAGEAITLRAADNGGKGLKGHAAVFGQRAWIGGKRWGWWEQIESGAFSKTIREKRAENNDIVLNRDHDNRLILARTSNGTLRLSEDSVGLAVDAEMGDYSYARDIEVALERRDLTGMSFAFDVVTWEWSVAEDDNDLLTLREIELFDVSVVGMPAYPQTDAALRSDLLACARAQGFDEPLIGFLATRLANPDDEVIATLRALARSDTTTPPAPPDGTRDDSAPPDGTRDEGQPAEQTTGAPHPLSVRMLRTRHQKGI